MVAASSGQRIQRAAGSQCWASATSRTIGAIDEKFGHHMG